MNKNETICTGCKLAGAIAPSLSDKGWVGCRKMLQIMQQEIEHPTYLSYLSNEEMASKLLTEIDCEEAALGWVDKGPLNAPAGHKFNDILMTKGTKSCKHIETNQQQK